MSSFLHRFHPAIFAVVLLTLTIAGCGTLDKLNPFSKPAAAQGAQQEARATADSGQNTPFVSQSKSGYVRLEPAESGAAANDHPFGFTATQIRAVLASLKIAQDREPLFSDDELNEIAAPIAAALSKATAREDIAFAVSGKHGTLSLLSSPVITSGRVFYKNGALNFIFGEMRSPAANQLTSTGWLQSFVLRDFPPGSRASPSRKAALAADGNVAYAVNNRRDWVVIAAQGVPPPLAVTPRAAPVAAPAAGASSVTGDAPATRGGTLDVEQRLTVLKGLHDKGLITEQEYNDKRKDILKDL